MFLICCYIDLPAGGQALQVHHGAISATAELPEWAAARLSVSGDRVETRGVRTANVLCTARHDVRDSHLFVARGW